MGSESKRQAKDRDRISELPNAILCHMLSFIPTKYAVRTSILSTRWKNIWASVANLHFDYTKSSIWCSDKHKPDYDRFLAFVDRVVALRDNSLDIQSFLFHCCCRAEDHSRIDGWIRRAISHNVVELDLRVETHNRDATLELPECVFMCKTLVVLKVSSNCIMYSPPTSGCFPSLKSLYVTVENPDNDSMEKIFCCCPVLECLTIYGFLESDNVLNFNISLPELKMLTLDLSHGFSPEDLDHQSNIFINCPKLEILDIDQDILLKFSFQNVRSLVKANVDLWYHYVLHQYDIDTRATALLRGLSNVKCLSLSAHFVEGCLPTFDNLRQLKLVLYDCYQWDLLTELLRKSLCLEHLVVEHKEDRACHYEYESDDEYSKDVLYSVDRWSEPQSVPDCLISHLKTVTIRGFKGYPHEKKVAKYLLKHGKVLSKLTIYNELPREFTESQRGSTACQVEFV